MLSGPAGSGKTSLACQWIEQAKLQVAWYSLDEEDNEPDQFFRYLLTTLIQAEQRCADTLGPILANPRGLQAEGVMPSLMEALSSLPQRVHLVLDDFHQITDSGIHAALAGLVEHIPASLQLVILSRHALPAPVDAAAVEENRMEITARDLKFTETESADFFKMVTSNGFSVHQIRELNRHLEGWAAGLQLIGLSLNAKGAEIADLPWVFNQAHDKLASYLIHDILRQQPQEIRDFVFATALLDRFNVELCTEVTGMPDAAGVLARLERMNLFLIPLDADRKWYRYHHMFCEIVRRQLAGPHADAIPRTMRKGARWLARNHYLEDALRTAFRFNDMEFAADLMEDYIMDYIEQYDLTTGLRWILKLPESMLRLRPLLRLQQCAFLFIMMAPAEVKEIIAAVDRNGLPDFSRYSGEKLALCQNYTAYFKCMLQILYAANAEAIAKFQALQGKCFPQNPLLVGAIEMLMVFILISNGDFTVAETFLARVSDRSHSDSGRMLAKEIILAKAQTLIARHRGRLRKAEAIIRQVLQIPELKACAPPSMASLLHRHLGHILYLRNRLEEARECLAIAEKYCRQSGLLDEIMAGNELRLQLHLAAKEDSLAVQCIRQMHALSDRLGMPRVAACADACAARLAIDQGNPAAALLWSQRRGLQEDEPFSLLFSMECLTQTRLLYALGQYLPATHLLETLRKRCVRRDLAELVLQIDILHAAILHKLDQPEKGQSRLEDALAYAQTEGYLRPFVNDADLIAPILKRIADRRPFKLSADYLETVLAACRIPLMEPAVVREPDYYALEKLSQREMEILECLSQGLKNQEIARETYISINTVKSHVRKILVKLNVKTRTQAILKARQLNLLP